MRDDMNRDIDPAVRCDACDAVCCRLTVLVLTGDDVPSWFTVHDEHGLEQMARHEDGWCAALDRDTMRCTIHARRPRICRDFAMGGGACRDERDAWYRPAARRIPARIVAGDA
jgi:Fe-S-cluster containining protein